MPSVTSDPSLAPGIVSQSQSLWDWPDSPVPSILSFQAVPSQPLPGRVSTATGLLSPDLLLARRLANFPDGLYDLSPSSTLTHFMAALMGDAGAGQLRRRQTTARLQSAVTGTSFYDLDSFYGALFGALRGPSGTLPASPATGSAFDPYTGLATADAWDGIYCADADFRERIIALARAITMGGTAPGLQALAEAVTGVPCAVYQTWALQEAAQESEITWSAIAGKYPYWLDFPAQDWNQLQGIPSYGGLGIGAWNEVIIQPRKSYPGTPDGLRQQAADTFGILSVAEVLKPAWVIVTVNLLQAAVDRPAPVRSLWADSDYWEITAPVTPPPGAAAACYATFSAAQQADGLPLQGSTDMPVPSPPYCQGQGTQYSYAADVTSVIAQVSTDHNLADVLDQLNYETTNFPSGQVTSWLPAWAVMLPARAASARTASPVTVQAAPYSGPRAPVKTAG